MNQQYAAKVYDEDIIKHNAAVLKCIRYKYNHLLRLVINYYCNFSIEEYSVNILISTHIFQIDSPSFVIDFVFVDSWFHGEDHIHRNDVYGTDQRKPLYPATTI